MGREVCFTSITGSKKQGREMVMRVTHLKASRMTTLTTTTFLTFLSTPTHLLLFQILIFNYYYSLSDSFSLTPFYFSALSLSLGKTKTLSLLTSTRLILNILNFSSYGCCILPR